MTKNSLLFSVLIANYNNEIYIGETLESIKQQSYPNIEIIIVDDASTDGSLESIRQYQKLDQRIRLEINSENKGCGYSVVASIKSFR